MKNLFTILFCCLLSTAYADRYHDFIVQRGGVSHYHFSQNSNDTIGTNNLTLVDGSYINTSPTIATRGYYWYYGGGSGVGFTGAHRPELSNVTEFTVSLSARLFDHHTAQILWSEYLDDNHQVSCLISGGNMWFQCKDGLYDQQTGIDITALDDTWHRWAFIYRGDTTANYRLQIFIDGVKLNTSAPIADVPTRSPAMNNPFFIGWHLSGAIDEFTIYNKALDRGARSTFMIERPINLNMEWLTLYNSTFFLSIGQSNGLAWAPGPDAPDQPASATYTMDYYDTTAEAPPHTSIGSYGVYSLAPIAKRAHDTGVGTSWGTPFLNAITTSTTSPVCVINACRSGISLHYDTTRAGTQTTQDYWMNRTIANRVDSTGGFSYGNAVYMMHKLGISNPDGVIVFNGEGDAYAGISKEQFKLDFRQLIANLILDTVIQSTTPIYMTIMGRIDSLGSPGGWGYYPNDRVVAIRKAQCELFAEGFVRIGANTTKGFTVDGLHSNILTRTTNGKAIAHALINNQKCPFPILSWNPGLYNSGNDIKVYIANGTSWTSSNYKSGIEGYDGSVWSQPNAVTKSTTFLRMDGTAPLDLRYMAKSCPDTTGLVLDSSVNKWGAIPMIFKFGYADAPFTFRKDTTITSKPIMCVLAADSFKVVAGTLPSGLALSKTTGALTGTPTDTITNSQVTIRAWGSSGADSISSVTTFTISDKDTISFIAPSGYVGTQKIILENTTYHTFDTVDFSFDTIPALSSALPLYAKLTPAAHGTITGTGVSVIDTVWYGTVKATIDSATYTTLYTTLPNQTVRGAKDIRTHARYGYRDTLVGAITYKNLHITSLTPSSGKIYDTVAFRAIWGLGTTGLNVKIGDSAAMVIAGYVDTLARVIAPTNVNGNYTVRTINGAGDTTFNSWRYGTSSKRRGVFGFSWGGFRF